VVAADEQGMWLQFESTVLDGFDRTATFLVALPFDPNDYPRAWGYWNLPTGPKWIGPRHTNFTDGSVCAFVPGRGPWQPGDRLDLLFDLYSVWAVRHLHLEEFGRWPGDQFSPHPFYSLVEFGADEFCGCDRNDPALLYGDCCRPEHSARRFIELKADFERKMGCRLTDRNPPPHVIDFAKGEGKLKSIRETMTLPAVINQRART
jgi:hypothetical protein